MKKSLSDILVKLTAPGLVIMAMMLWGCPEEIDSTVGINGVVVDSAGNPIQDAMVKIAGSTLDSITTGMDGAFSFSGLQEGDWTLNIRKNGFLSFETSFHLDEGTNYSETITLEKIFIRPSIAYISVKPGSGNYTVKIASNVPWTVEVSSSAWFTLSRLSGAAGLDSITVSWSYETMLTSRTDSFIVRGQGASSSIVVFQQAPFLNTSTSLVEVGNSAGSQTINVFANTPWIFLPLIPASWVTYEVIDYSDNNGKVKITWQANNTGFDRSAQFQIMGPETFIVPVTVFQFQ